MVLPVRQIVQVIPAAARRSLRVAGGQVNRLPLVARISTPPGGAFHSAASRTGVQRAEAWRRNMGCQCHCGLPPRAQVWSPEAARALPPGPICLDFSYYVCTIRLE